MDKQAVLERVRLNLKRHRMPNAELEVVEDGVRQDNGFWYVPVKPSTPLSRSFEFYDALAVAEDELDSEDKLNVLLVPVYNQPDE
jgi:hypothetical protein